jgi:hypothetical protein
MRDRAFRRDREGVSRGCVRLIGENCDVVQNEVKIGIEYAGSLRVATRSRDGAVQ